MSESLYLDYVADREFLTVKILVRDRKGLYETTRTMIPWEVLIKGMEKARATARRKVARAKRKAAKRAAKKVATKKKRPIKRGRK